MKHTYLIAGTAYKMLYLASFLQIAYRYQIRKNVQNQNTDLSNIEISKKKIVLKICQLILTHMILAVLQYYEIQIVSVY